MDSVRHETEHRETQVVLEDTVPTLLVEGERISVTQEVEQLQVEVRTFEKGAKPGEWSLTKETTVSKEIRQPLVSGEEQEVPAWNSDNEKISASAEYKDKNLQHNFFYMEEKTVNQGEGKAYQRSVQPEEGPFSSQRDIAHPPEIHHQTKHKVSSTGTCFMSPKNSWTERKGDEAGVLLVYTEQRNILESHVSVCSEDKEKDSDSVEETLSHVGTCEDITVKKQYSAAKGLRFMKQANLVEVDELPSESPLCLCDQETVLSTPKRVLPQFLSKMTAPPQNTTVPQNRREPSEVKSISIPGMLPPEHTTSALAETLPEEFVQSRTKSLSVQAPAHLPFESPDSTVVLAKSGTTPARLPKKAEPKIGVPSTHVLPHKKTLHTTSETIPCQKPAPALIVPVDKVKTRVYSREDDQKIMQSTEQQTLQKGILLYLNHDHKKIDFLQRLNISHIQYSLFLQSLE